MTTSIIIPIYILNESFAEMTKACLDSLRYGRPDEVIIVDDGSPVQLSVTGDYKWVRKEGNDGYITSMNAGLAIATGGVLIPANNDLLFTPGWLEAILEPLNQGYDLSLVRLSDCDGYSIGEGITENENFGALWAMKREVYEKVGPLDERFGKGTFEDQDYKQRVIESGFRIGKNNACLVEHIGRATFKEIDPHESIFIENRRRYKDKWGRVDR